MSNFDHLIQIDTEKRELVIFRIENDGSKVFYTSTPLPDLDMSESIDGFQDFARQLGENILLDSPAIRRIYGL